MDGYLSFKFMEKDMYLTSTKDDNITFSPEPEKFTNAELIQKILFPFCKIIPVEEGKKKRKYFLVTDMMHNYFHADGSGKFSNLEDALEFSSLEFAKDVARKYDAFVLPLNFKFDVIKNGYPVQSFSDYMEAIKCALHTIISKELFDQDKIEVCWVDDDKIIVKEDPAILRRRIIEKNRMGLGMGAAMSMVHGGDFFKCKTLGDLCKEESGTLSLLKNLYDKLNEDSSDDEENIVKKLFEKGI